jgi:hypothetical protein
MRSAVSAAAWQCASFEQQLNTKDRVNTNSTLHTERRVVDRVGLAALGLIALCSTASAADKPPLAPDTVAPFSTESRISAAIEFGLPALAADVEKNIPRRLATIDFGKLEREFDGCNFGLSELDFLVMIDEALQQVMVNEQILRLVVLDAICSVCHHFHSADE